MRAMLNFPRALVVGTLCGLLAAACQTYDFEPVEPLAISQTTETRRIEARARKPNLMLLVDTSGSMTAPVNPALAACKLGNGQTCGADANNPCNTAVCPTRWSDLQSAMSSFLEENGTIARIGLATYPNPTTPTGEVAGCGATSALSVALPTGDLEDDNTLKTNSSAARAALQAIKNSRSGTSDRSQIPTGGTPTSTSLQFLGSRPELQSTDRADFVVLLTDGLPNCNAKFPKPYPDPTCFCILATCDNELAKTVGCLDTDASVSAVQGLRNTDPDRDIKTIVIGFGTDFKANTDAGRRGAATLNGMAEAGGFSRECSTNADCGSDDTCDAQAGFCRRRFYQAENKEELSEALKAIANKVVADAPCELTIPPEQQPSSEDLVVVYLNKERLTAGPDTWTLKSPGIVFLGSTCAKIEASSPALPAEIEVRAVQKR